MPKASVKRLIDCRKDKLIEFVLDIEKYPEFIPFCENSKIYKKNIDGPLNHLSNNWTFTDKRNGITEVTFDIDFEIKNKFLNSLMVVSFQFGLEKIADAFQKRAEDLFGSSKN